MTTSGKDGSAVPEAIPEDTAGIASKVSETQQDHRHVAQNARAPEAGRTNVRRAEHGGQAGLEPTRYGDWEKKGRCTDF